MALGEMLHRVRMRLAMRRKVYSAVLWEKVLQWDWQWILHKAYTYLFLKAESFLKTGYSPMPLACGLVVTENCNMRCPMCVLPHRYKENPNDQDTATWKQVIDDLHAVGIGGIAINGGEPTVRKDAFELLRHAKDKQGTTVVLNSNLQALTDQQIRELLETGLDNINVSVDSGRDDVCDRLRGAKHVLAKVLKNIQALARARDAAGKKFSITAVTTLSDLNLDDLEIIFEKTAKAGADRIGFIPLHDIKNNITYTVRQPKAKSDLYAALQALSNKYQLPLKNSARYLKALYPVMTGGPRKIHCNTGYTLLVVGTDLKIYRCIPYMNTGRSLFQWDPARQRLKDLWNSRLWREDRVKALSCQECFWNCHAEVSLLVKM
jgi:MoaA/NifB/PqqE/SkfB family radical SAM enzyme